MNGHPEATPSPQRADAGAPSQKGARDGESSPIRAGVGPSGLRPGAALAIAFASGAVLSLAFPEPDVAPLAWVALAPLLWITRGTGGRRAAGLWFAFGTAFFGTLLIWISHVGYVAWAVLVLLQAGFLAVFGVVFARSTRGRGPVVACIAAAAAWVALEYVRSLVPVGGFTWGQLSQSQHNLSMWTLRPAAWGGGWLVAGLCVGVNACIAVVMGERALRPRLGAAAAAVALLAAPLALPVGSADGPSLRVAIVQGNVPRSFSGSFYEKELAITRSHQRLTERLSDVDLVVWPESSVGLDIRRDAAAASAVSEAARAVGAPMLVGGNLDIDRERYRVVVFHVDPEGRVVDVYRKTHLVPFGEYVPARGLLGWIPMLDQVPRDAVPGSGPGVFDVAGTKVATAISFEGDFASVGREAVAAGGRVLVVATNTSTWGESWASAQHLAFSQVRAVENGVPVVHAALSGISGLIDEHGRVRERTPLWTATTLEGEVSAAGSTTFYTRTGDWFPWICLVITIALLVTVARRREAVV